MNPINFKTEESEAKIQDELIKYLTWEKWFCMRTHGNANQAGFPDVFACHKRFGSRWIELKKAKGGCYTQAQLNVFTKFASKNIGVWTLTGYSDYDRKKLFLSPNWHSLLSTSRGIKLDKDVKRITKHGPEGKIQDAVIKKLTAQDWFVIETYGSMFQSGFPDLYICHKKFGAKWLEIKNPAGYKFTSAQIDCFPAFAAQGVGIWILTSEHETDKIFGPANWHQFLWGSK